jgi:tRNA dimethylallyltransferase
MTAARFIELAAAKVCEVAARGRMPLLVGGTGLYLDGLLHGMDAIPDIDPAVRARVALEVESRGPQAMHMRLALVDPEYAVKIHPNDRQRITRALEVFESTGRPFSSFHAGAGPHAEQPPRFDALKIGITEEREALAERMALRIEAMLEAGALEEVARAREVCAEDAPAFSAIGCGELLAHLAGRLSLEEAKAVWLKRTRDYAKRQLTWFRRDESIHWLAPQETDDALDLVREWLTRR